MKKFLIQYKCQLETLDSWMKKPEEERKGEETRLMGEWQKWAEANKASIVENFGVGKTKKVDTNGIDNFRNEIMLAGIVQAETLDDAAKMFEGHPHLQIPTAWIEISEINPMN